MTQEPMIAVSWERLISFEANLPVSEVRAALARCPRLSQSELDQALKDLDHVLAGHQLDEGAAGGLAEFLPEAVPLGDREERNRQDTSWPEVTHIEVAGNGPAAG